MKKVIEPTFWIRLYLAGDISDIRRVCREYCYEVGLCVTVKPCDFIYTGGQESGAEVGLVNYPRFPSSVDELREKADSLAVRLAEGCYQQSVLIVDTEKTQWLTRRDE